MASWRPVSPRRGAWACPQVARDRVFPTSARLYPLASAGTDHSPQARLAAQGCLSWPDCTLSHHGDQPTTCIRGATLLTRKHAGISHFRRPRGTQSFAVPTGDFSPPRSNGIPKGMVANKRAVTPFFGALLARLPAPNTPTAFRTTLGCRLSDGLVACALC